MAEAPERLWLWPAEPEDGVDKFVSFPDQPYPSGSTEYIRAEKAEAELAAVEAVLRQIVESDDMAADLFTNDGDRADNFADRARAALSHNGRKEDL